MKNTPATSRMTIDKVFAELSAVAKTVSMQLEASAGVVETAAIARAYASGISQLYLLLRPMQLEAWDLEERDLRWLSTRKCFHRCL